MRNLEYSLVEIHWVTSMGCHFIEGISAQLVLTQAGCREEVLQEGALAQAQHAVSLVFRENFTITLAGTHLQELQSIPPTTFLTAQGVSKDLREMTMSM